MGEVDFAAAISEHPVTSYAAGEVTGQVLETLGERPDLAVVFATAHHIGALEDIASTIEEVLHPLVLVGTTAESVIGPHREVERSGALVLFAARTGPVLGVSLEATGENELSVLGWPDHLAFEPQALVLFADPFSFPVTDFLAWLEGTHPGLTVTGGLSSSALGPGGNRLLMGTSVKDRGAVGFVLGRGIDLETVVSQGCRPFGLPLVVTRSEGSLIYELAGRPALERLVTQAQAELGPQDVDMLQAGALHIGRVVDEMSETFGPGDFLLRSVLGADRSNGAIAVGDAVPLGSTVQFHLRDANAADAELRRLLENRRCDAALLFSCNGRGTHMFAYQDHDVGVMTEKLGLVPVAGFFAAGEICPIKGRNFLSGFTASMLLMRSPTSRPVANLL